MNELHDRITATCFHIEAAAWAVPDGLDSVILLTGLKMLAVSLGYQALG